MNGGRGSDAGDDAIVGLGYGDAIVVLGEIFAPGLEWSDVRIWPGDMREDRKSGVGGGWRGEGCRAFPACCSSIN